MSEQSALADSLARHRNFDQEAWRYPIPPGDEHETASQTASQEEHYASVIGAFQDDPMLDAMMANIRERRREMDAENLTE